MRKWGVVFAQDIPTTTILDRQQNPYVICKKSLSLSTHSCHHMSHLLMPDPLPKGRALFGLFWLQ